jgi:tripartite-type tricarboxylate transporter receptor subunit TctC
MQTVVKRQRLRLIFLLSFFLWVFGNLPCEPSFAAQQTFPDKPISIVVNYGPGGARDIIARGVGRFMGKYLGVPAVVVNEPASGGARGLARLYHAAPDGYTIGIGSGSDITNQIIEKKEYDFKKFTTLGRTSSSSSVVFVRPDSPLRSVKDFKRYGKPVRFSTFSLTSNITVAFMVIANRDNFPLEIMAGYRSASDALQGLIRGEVEFSGGAPSTSVPFMQAGQIKPILTLGPNRHPDYPGIPSIGEEGYPDLATFSTDLWLIGPPGIPKGRVQILERALMNTLTDAEFLRWAKGAGVDVKPLVGKEVAETISILFSVLEKYKKDIEKYRK